VAVQILFIIVRFGLSSIYLKTKILQCTVNCMGPRRCMGEFRLR